MKYCVPIGLVLALFTGSLAAFAHDVSIFAAREGDSIRGYVYFSGGAPVAQTIIRVEDSAGEKMGEVTTDDEGEFSYPIGETNLTFVVDLPDGHRDSFTLHAEGAGANGDLVEPHTHTHDHGDADMERVIEDAVSRQVAPLRRQIDAYQRTVRMHDIIGGIGYIAGVLGLIAWFKSRSGKGAARD